MLAFPHCHPPHFVSQIDYDIFLLPRFPASDANAPQHMQRLFYVMENYQSARDKQKSEPNRRQIEETSLRHMHLTHANGWGERWVKTFISTLAWVDTKIIIIMMMTMCPWIISQQPKCWTHACGRPSKIASFHFISFHFISLLYVFVRICLQTMEQCGPATEMPKNSRKDHKGKTVVAASFRSPITPRPQLQHIWVDWTANGQQWVWIWFYLAWYETLILPLNIFTDLFSYLRPMFRALLLVYVLICQLNSLQGNSKCVENIYA